MHIFKITSILISIYLMISHGAICICAPIVQDFECGQSLFPSPARYEVACAPRGLLVSDFNGDGFEDLATFTADSNSVSILLGKANGTFFPFQEYEIFQSTGLVGLADFNNDSIDDIVLTINNSRDISISFGNADGSFESGIAQDFGFSDLCMVASGDLNDDGMSDLIFSDLFSSAKMLINNGDGTFSSPIDLPTPMSSGDSRSALIDDLNNDGLNDIVISVRQPSQLIIFHSIGIGKFSIVQEIDTLNSPAELQTADFNNDGVKDIVVEGFNGFAVHLGNGDGTYSPRVFTGVSSITDIALCDMDNDGILDAFASAHGARTVRVLTGVGDGTFVLKQCYTLDAASSIVAADFNNDSWCDIATTNRPDDSIAVLFGTDTGTLVYPTLLVPEGNPISITANDLNGDSIPDLAAAVPLSDNVSEFDRISVFIGEGSGAFQPPFQLEVPNSIRSLASADLNNDGVVDIVSSHFGSIINVHLGDGIGTFQTPMNFSVGNSTTTSMFELVDLNSDEILDVVAANSIVSDVAILLGQGDGTFLSPVFFDAGHEPVFATSADFDGDGNIDLITVSGESNTARILIGNGDGTFDSPLGVFAGDLPTTIVTGDFDADGNIDFATASDTQNNDGVYVGLGIGNGDFQILGEFYPLSPSSTRSNAIKSEDFNGDGILDIVTSNDEPFGISVLLGIGDGSFLEQQQIVNICLGPNDIAIADLNGDGLLDIAAAVFFTEEIPILINQCSGILLGDLNLDGVANLLDVAPFIELILSDSYQTEGDVNQDGFVNLLDVEPFVQILLGA